MRTTQVNLGPYVGDPTFDAALAMLRDFKSHFPECETYIVGGVPRDILMGRHPSDFDFATNIPLDKLSLHMVGRTANISKDDAQPVLSVRYLGEDFDVAAFRTDSTGNVGRQSNVSTLTDSIEQDLKRRDLTINALAMDENGVVYDYSTGFEDITNGVIRSVGDPVERFKEDATRILRVIRFAAALDFEIEGVTVAAVKECKHLLTNPNLISNESISREFVKASKTGKSLMRFCRMLHHLKILHWFLPEFTALEGMMHNPKYHPEGDSTVIGHIYECLLQSRSSDPATNLAILFHDLGKGPTHIERSCSQSLFPTYHGHEGSGVPIVEKIFARLKFHDIPSHKKEHILICVGKHMLIHNLDDLSLKTLAKTVHHDSWEMLVQVGYADEASRGYPLFEESEFILKIDRANLRVSTIASNHDELRLKFKAYIDGHKVKGWFPEDTEKDPKIVGVVLAHLTDYIYIKLDAGAEPTAEEIETEAKTTFSFLK